MVVASPVVAYFSGAVGAGDSNPDDDGDGDSWSGIYGGGLSLSSESIVISVE